MLLDFLRLGAFYLMCLVIFTMMGFIFFFYREEFRDPVNTILLLFSASMGSFDFTLTTDNNTPPYSNGEQFVNIGFVYQIIWVIFSNVLILNLLIAMFSSTYSKLVGESVGIYLMEIIKSRPRYLQDPHYSGLIFIPFPLSAILIPLIPLYIVIKNKTFNSIVITFEFILIYMTFSLPILLVGSALGTVLAYLRALLNKLQLICRKTKNVSTGRKVFNFVWFTLFGPILLIINNLFDLVKYSYFIFKPEA